MDDLVRSLFFFGSGVDLFFCISGYVVSKNFINFIDAHKNKGQQWLAIRAFWLKRLLRLLPSAWFWAFFGIICSTHFSEGNFSSFSANVKSTIAIVTFSGNIVQWLNGGLGSNIAYWSLALEEQFYFIFPFFILFTPIRWRWKLLLIVVAIQFFVYRGGGILWFTRFDGFIWGILIPLFSQSRYYQWVSPNVLKNKNLSV